MVNFKRLYKKIILKNSPPPFKALEQRLTEAFALERKVNISKEFSAAQKQQARQQFIVFMVSCLECYLKDIFTKMIDYEIILPEKLVKIPKIQRIQLNISQLYFVNKNKIKFSEIVTDELNFQSFSDIMQLCRLLDFEKHFIDFMKTAKDQDVGFSKEESEQSLIDLTQHVAKYGRTKKLQFDKLFTKMIIKNLYRQFNEKDKDAVLGTVKMAINMRHQIVHEATKPWMPYKEFQISIFLSIIIFCAVIQEIYKSHRIKSTKK